jgi:hypothetical protein
MTTPPLLRASGILRYSPEIRPGSHTRRDGGSSYWWLIIDCDPELGRYLRYLYEQAYWQTRPLTSPLWGPHISVIRGEQPADTRDWGRGNGERIEFDYTPEAEEIHRYVWHPVRCDAVLDLREHYGLAREPAPPLHLSIGNGISLRGSDSQLV